MRVVLVKGLFWFPGLIRSTYLFFSLLVLASCVRSNFINFSYSFEAAKCSRGTQLFFCELVGGPARVSYKLVGTDSVIHLPSAFPQGSHTNCITVCSFDRKGISAIVFCHLFDSKRWISVIWTPAWFCLDRSHTFRNRKQFHRLCFSFWGRLSSEGDEDARRLAPGF